MFGSMVGSPAPTPAQNVNMSPEVLRLLKFQSKDYANMTDAEWDALYAAMDPNIEIEYVALGPAVGAEIIKD